MLRVKQGRKYYFEGREYLSGEKVTAYIPPSYLPMLTNEFGPLEEIGTRAAVPGRAINAGTSDLPPRVMTPKEAPKPQEPQRPLAEAPEQKPARKRGTYERRDIVPGK